MYICIHIYIYIYIFIYIYICVCVCLGNVNTVSHKLECNELLINQINTKNN